MAGMTPFPSQGLQKRLTGKCGGKGWNSGRLGDVRRELGGLDVSMLCGSCPEHWVKNEPGVLPTSKSPTCRFQDSPHSQRPIQPAGGSPGLSTLQPRQHPASPS